MSSAANTLTLSRDVSVIRIPSGETISLPSGTSVIITQALGGSYTIVVPSQAGLYRVSGDDADALGRDKAKANLPTPTSYSEEALWDQMRTCYDPEIPVNIVDLGLIYKLDAKDSGNGTMVRVEMTLTAAGCGMGPSIAGEVQRKLLNVPGVATANVELVWEPAWNSERITPAGREKLGMEV
jgi:probable FeS assembly SUF system protein SufT